MRSIESHSTMRGQQSLAPRSITKKVAVKLRVEFKSSSRSHPQEAQPCNELISNLAESIGVQTSSLKPLIDFQPNLLGLHASQSSPSSVKKAEKAQKQVVSRMLYLSQSLSLPMELIIKMTAKQPGVLSAPPSMILERAADIERRLSIPRGSILHLLCHQPEFLEMSPERLVSRTLQLASTIGEETSPLDVLKSLSRLNPPSALLSFMAKRNSSISLRIAQLNELLGAPGISGPIPMVDDPTLNEDGSVRFQPVLMRNPLPGALESLKIPMGEMKTVRRNLRRAAHQLETGAKAAGRLRSGTGTSYSAVIPLKCPDLFLIPMDEIASSHQMLLSLLQVPIHRLSSLLLRCPTLLSLSSHQIQDSWTCLTQELRADSRSLRTRVLQQPQILALTAQEIQSRMRAMEEGLGWTRASTQRAVWNQCQLLGMSIETIRSKIEWLAQVLDLSEKGNTDTALGPATCYETAARLAVKQPAILTLSTTTLSRNLQGLASALKLYPLQPSSCSSIKSVVESEPSLLTQTPTTLSKKMEHISSVLDLPSPIPLILEHPIILSMPTANLVYVIQELQMIHDCSRTEAIELLKASPRELLRS